MSITLKAFQEFSDIGYPEDALLLQFQMNKALDRICKKSLGSAAQFDRDLSQQAWDDTQKDEDRRCTVRNFLQTMQRKDTLKFLFFRVNVSSPPQVNNKKPSENVIKKQNKQSVSRPLNESLKDSVDPVDQKKEDKMKRDSINYENIRQSELSTVIQNPIMKKDITFWKRFSICSVICMAISIIMVFILPPFINYLIKQTAIEMAVLSPDTQGFWAHFPGDSKTIITRNWTFFNLTNSQQMLLYGQKPKFRQISGFIIQQLEDYLNITYLDDGDRVRMIDWLHFNQFQGSRNLDQKVKIVNVGGLGYWYNLKLARPTLLLQQGLGLVFTTLQDSILQTVYAQGINAQFLSDVSIAEGIYTNAGISKQNWVFLWQDDAYGMQDKDNLRIWVSAALGSKQQGGFSYEANYLKDYFTLSDSQLQYVLKTFEQYCDALQTILVKNTFCPDIPLQNCTGRYLAYKQMAESFVTNNPPPNTTAPTNTICQDNVTCHGYFPEISAFYEEIYIKKHPQADPKLSFSPELVKKWINYNDSIQHDLDYNTAQNCLFHIGNLDALWQNGTLSDELPNGIPNKYLQNIMKRFELPSIQHTKVFWEWIKYLTNELILQKNTNQEVGISTLFTKGLYQSFSQLQDNLQTFLLTKLIVRDIKSVNHNCQDFVSRSFQLTVGSSSISKICDHYGHEVGTQKFVKDMIDSCKFTFQKTWNQLKTFTNNSRNLQSLCDPNSETDTFGFYYNKQRVYLNDSYHCNMTPYKYCSDYQLAAIQWASSAITKNPPEGINLQSCQSFGQWDSSFDKFEYFYYRSKFPSDDTFPQFDIAKAYSLLNFDNWFSSSVVLSIFANHQTPKSLKDYMRYVSIQSGLNGFTTERTARELMFGYNDPILEQVKNSYPPFGGDPSTPSLVAFNDLNITKEEANLQLQWNTGKKDYTLLSQYRKVNKLNYINIPKDSFNGNITKSEFVSPWIGQDYFYGTSAKQFAPNQFESNNISLYVPNLQRYGSGTSKDTFPFQRFGFDLQIAYLGQSIFLSTSESDFNKKYYQSFFGIFNQTSVVGIPLFVNKNHFMNCSSNWSSFIQIYNEDESIKYQQTSHWDDSFVIIQPYSGVSFQATIYLQTNYFHQPDQLVTYPQASMLPIFSLNRSGNITEQVCSDLFGPLLVGLAAIDWVRYTGVAFLVISTGVLLFSINKRRRVEKNLKDSILQTKIKSSGLGISLQQQFKDEESKEKEQREGLRQILLQD